LLAFADCKERRGKKDKQRGVAFPEKGEKKAKLLTIFRKNLQIFILAAKRPPGGKKKSWTLQASRERNHNLLFGKGKEFSGSTLEKKNGSHAAGRGKHTYSPQQEEEGRGTSPTPLWKKEERTSLAPRFKKNFQAKTRGDGEGGQKGITGFSSYHL